MASGPFNAGSGSTARDTSFDSSKTKIGAENVQAALETILNDELPKIQKVDDRVTALAGSTIPKETGEVILPEQAMTFIGGQNSFPNCIACQAGAAIGLQVGETYIVRIDGVEYQCPVRSLTNVDADGTYGYIWVGNGNFAGLGTDTGESFLVGDIFFNGNWGMSGVALAYQGDTPQVEETHTVGIARKIHTLDQYYTKAEVDAALGSYINDIDALIGIDDSMLEGGGA